MRSASESSTPRSPRRGSACYSSTVKLIAVLIAIAACSTSSAPEPHKKPHEPRVARDAGQPGVTQLPGYDPTAGHLDDDTGPRPQPSTLQPPHAGHAIDVMLRSSPPGATVSVDGVVVGTTPAYWYGAADGREHEFTFVLPGHAVARYRFVPVSNGFIHARLVPVSDKSDSDGEVDEGESPAVPGAGSVLVNPPPAPQAGKADATAITPDASAGSAPATGFGPQP
jgi:hypothetical protein